MEFVSFEIAKKLKEKGFDKECFGWYYPSEVCGFDYKTTIVFNNSVYRGSNYKDMLVLHKNTKYIDAPTISQVLKWLREEKKFYIVPLIYSDWSEDADGIICEEWLFWSYKVININDGRIVYNEIDKIDNGNFENYVQAALAGIEFVIDNLI